MMSRLTLALSLLVCFNGGTFAQGSRGPVRMGPMARAREQLGAGTLFGGGNGFGGAPGGPSTSGVLVASEVPVVSGKSVGLEALDNSVDSEARIR
ncbi:hypothetical protein PF002_g9822 [Phytophthora fragariae]|uniref:RxLR effector protein n=1 Tax=Phytophthora fragariae TaxID=53985 RepID=A0A6A3ZV54_9STRA|nr:hypothetical protein PF002_g9822 [Phytophthora fragariae]